MLYHTPLNPSEVSTKGLSTTLLRCLLLDWWSSGFAVCPEAISYFVSFCCLEKLGITKTVLLVGLAFFIFSLSLLYSSFSSLSFSSHTLSYVDKRKQLALSTLCLKILVKSTSSLGMYFFMPYQWYSVAKYSATV